MRITDMPMYKALAIGLTAGQKKWIAEQLSIAKLNAKERGYRFSEEAQDVSMGFSGEDTPQGHNFWRDIYTASRRRGQ